VKRQRRAKIIATVGPSSSSREMLMKLFYAGVDTFRLNFSHGDHNGHSAVHANIRSIEVETGRPIGILQDLQGPKIRIGQLKKGPIDIKTGETVRFTLDKEGSEKNSIPLPHPEVLAALCPGHGLFIDDGKVRLQVTKVGHEFVDAIVTAGGLISDRKGVNLPDTILDLSPLTEKDREDLNFGLKLGVDWVALSFVQRPADLLDAMALINGQAGLIAKIEKPSALDCIDDIVAIADGIMVARGDLGVEIPPEDVPGRQKELIQICRRAVKPVIVATQMLDSMTSFPNPTRAETSDVATAIYDGADAVMLSAESASGSYPLATVEMMDRIIRRTEEHRLYRSTVSALDFQTERTPPHAIAEASVNLAEVIGAPAVAAFTSSGVTAARIAGRRSRVPILAITPDLNTLRRLTMVWGIYSVLSEDVDSYEQMVHRSSKLSLGENFVKAGDFLVVVAGVPFARQGTTNNLRIVQIKKHKP
jgi:pyruvate kinase